MAWVFIIIAVGASCFLVLIIVDYLKVSLTLKPKADLARNEIRQCEMRIEAEKKATETTKKSVDTLSKEIEEMQKELVGLEKDLEEFQERERRRKPTKFKLEE
jgi:septal ring factor EnvC (AmiA/AmiB activator)